jgi:hypothetical protein
MFEYLYKCETRDSTWNWDLTETSRLQRSANHYTAKLTGDCTFQSPVQYMLGLSVARVTHCLIWIPLFWPLKISEQTDMTKRRATLAVMSHDFLTRMDQLPPPPPPPPPTISSIKTVQCTSLRNTDICLETTFLLICFFLTKQLKAKRNDA